MRLLEKSRCPSLARYSPASSNKESATSKDLVSMISNQRTKGAFSPPTTLHTFRIPRLKSLVVLIDRRRPQEPRRITRPHQFDSHICGLRGAEVLFMGCGVKVGESNREFFFQKKSISQLPTTAPNGRPTASHYVSKVPIKRPVKRIRPRHCDIKVSIYQFHTIPRPAGAVVREIGRAGV